MLKGDTFDMLKGDTFEFVELYALYCGYVRGGYIRVCRVICIILLAASCAMIYCQKL